MAKRSKTTNIRKKWQQKVQKDSYELVFNDLSFFFALVLKFRFKLLRKKIRPQGNCVLTERKIENRKVFNTILLFFQSNKIQLFSLVKQATTTFNKNIVNFSLLMKTTVQLFFWLKNFITIKFVSKSIYFFNVRLFGHNFFFQAKKQPMFHFGFFSLPCRIFTGVHLHLVSRRKLENTCKQKVQRCIWCPHAKKNWIQIAIVSRKYSRNGY